MVVDASTAPMTLYVTHENFARRVNAYDVLQRFLQGLVRRSHHGASHPMRFEILDVEHGFCAYAVGSDGGVLLFDCGHGSVNRPSTYLPDRGITNIRRFFVTNYDEDHISDLLAARRNLHIEVLTRNASMTSGQIRSLKTPPISPAMNELLGMIESFTGGVTPEQLEPAGLQRLVFLQRLSDVHRYEQPEPPHVPRRWPASRSSSEATSNGLGGLPCSRSRACRNSSSVPMSSSPRTTDARAAIAPRYSTTAGHALVVMSDGPIQHDTQRMAGTYARHALGDVVHDALGPRDPQGGDDEEGREHLLEPLTYASGVSS